MQSDYIKCKFFCRDSSRVVAEYSLNWGSSRQSTAVVENPKFLRYLSSMNSENVMREQSGLSIQVLAGYSGRTSS